MVALQAIAAMDIVHYLRSIFVVDASFPPVSDCSFHSASVVMGHLWLR